MTTYFTDVFTGTNGAAWNSSNWTSIFNGTGASATIQTNKGRANAGTVADPSNKKGMRYFGSTHADYELTTKFTFVNGNDGSMEIWLRASTSDPDGTGYFLSLSKNGSNALLYKAVNYTYTQLGSTPLSPGTGTEYACKVYAVGTSIKLKVWATSGSEPGSYQVSVTDSAVAAAGYAYVAALNGGASGVIIDFDDTTLTDGTGNAFTFTASCQPATSYFKTLVTKAPFAGSSTAVGTFSKIRVVVKLFTASATATGAYLKTAQKRLSGTVSATGVAIKKVPRAFAGSTTGTGFLRRSSVRVFTGSTTGAGTFVSTFLGRVFGRPGIISTVARAAAEVRIRIRKG